MTMEKNEIEKSEDALTGSTGRVSAVDVKFDGNITTATLSNRLFIRAVAKVSGLRTWTLSFRFFDHSYFRKCVFDSYGLKRST